MYSESRKRIRDIQMTKSSEQVEIGKRRRVGSLGNSAAEERSETSTQTGRDEMIYGDCVIQGQALDPKGPESPDSFLRKLVSSQSGIKIDDSKLTCNTISPDFFDSISEEEMSSYTTAVATAVRGNNVEEIQRLQQDSGLSLNCCNRFGESLLHIACRRGFVDMAKLILDQPGVSVRLSDDCGRNPLHDLCWNPTPQLEICKWLLEREPILFFLRDKRNFTPLDYARQEHWQIWKTFFLENKDSFKALEGESYSFLGSQTDLQ